MRFSHFESTPNPNAVKCVIVPDTWDSGPRSYFTPDQADQADDPLAQDLFATPGVTNVLIHTLFITVCKAPDAKWPVIKRSIKAAILKHGSPDT